jgi:hypothetical protein
MASMKTPDVTVVVTKSRGRPRVQEPLEQVGTRLPVPYYDRLVQIAHDREMSVSGLVRQLLILRLR